MFLISSLSSRSWSKPLTNDIRDLQHHLAHLGNSSQSGDHRLRDSNSNLEEKIKADLVDLRKLTHDNFMAIRDDLEQLGNFSRDSIDELQSDLQDVHGLSGGSIEQLRADLEEARSVLTAKIGMIQSDEFDLSQQVSHGQWSTVCLRV